MSFTPGTLCFDAVTGDVLPDLEEQGRDLDAGRRDRLYCSACRYPITGRDMAIEFNGNHIHTRVNPAGITYEFACFRHAPGCTDSGPPTGEHSWFAGYLWQVALCGACGLHLGWRFRGSSGFYGLVVARLVSDNQ